MALYNGVQGHTTICTMTYMCNGIDIAVMHMLRSKHNMIVTMRNNVPAGLDKHGECRWGNR